MTQPRDPDPIGVTVNGEPRELHAGASVADLLHTLGVRGERVAVEHNRAILPRERFSETMLRDGDRLEIVHFVGGG